MKKIGLFYAPKAGSTEEVAKKIGKAIGEDNVDVIYIDDAKVSDFDNYENLIIGTATVGQDTWDGEHPKSAWDKAWPEFNEYNFSGKKVALFGLGNQVTYPDNFVDSLGQFGKQALTNGATIVGEVETEGYNFTGSDAIVDGKFIGLPIDEDSEPEKTDERIEGWLKIILAEFH